MFLLLNEEIHYEFVCVAICMCVYVAKLSLPINGEQIKESPYS